MDFRIISRFIGLFTLFFIPWLTLPLAVSIFYGEYGPALAFTVAITVGIFIGVPFYVWGRGHQGDLLRKEAFVIVTIGWLLISFIGALPFYLSGEIKGLIDCYFETMSGFTTTGASILTHIESLSKGILFWRSFTHWLGGMGIIFLFIIFIPNIGVGGKLLFDSEVSGFQADHIKPRIKDTAMSLWKIYLVFTALGIIALIMSGMNLFDSLCHTFGALATGGFSTRDQSIAHYKSPIVETIIIILMIVGAVNFSIYYGAIKEKNLKSFLRDTEFKVFIILILAGIILISLDTITNGFYNNIFSAIRYASFQVVSIITATGFSTENFDLWPSFSKMLLVVFMFIGGCAGSTAGGIKVIRIVVLVKMAFNSVRKVLHPLAVTNVRVGDLSLSKDVQDSVLGFFVIYLFIFIMASIVMAALGLNVITAITSVCTAMGNVGPGLGGVGPAVNFSNIPVIGKLVLIFCMLAGRLELYTLLTLFFPSFWKG